MKNYTNLILDDFLAAIKRNPHALIIDVRTLNEYNDYHLPNAINIDIKHTDFEEDINELNHDAHYYVYCSLGIRSANACTYMRQQGFRYVYNLKKGLKNGTGVLTRPI